MAGALSPAGHLARRDPKTSVLQGDFTGHCYDLGTGNPYSARKGGAENLQQPLERNWSLRPGMGWSGVRHGTVSGRVREIK